MTVSVILPAYNEEVLIITTIQSIVGYLEKKFQGGEIVIINDGSTDHTRKTIEAFIDTHSGKIAVTLENNSKNFGKGYSIKKGMRIATGDVRIFMDADLPFDLEAVRKIDLKIRAGEDMVIGDRNDPESNLANVHPLRKFAGVVYSFFIQTIVRDGITDTQCGLKGFSADAAEFIFPKTTIHGFGFDVEVLRIAQKHSFSISRIPVHMLKNRPDSRVHLFRDSLMMLWNLVVIRWNDLNGRYD